MSETRKSGKRQSTSSKNTARGGRKSSSAKPAASAKKPVVEQGNGIWDEVRLVLVLLTTVFLFISNFGVGGFVGAALSKVMFGFLGLFAYVFPAALFVMILFSLANRGNVIVTVKLIGALLGCVALSALLHWFTVGESIEGWKEIYAYCADKKTGGGILGGLVYGALYQAFGKLGAVLVLLGLFIICAVIVTEKSFVRGMSRGSQKVYDSAKRDMERRREAAEARREQRTLQRQEQKVSGVAADVTIPRQPEPETALPFPEDIPDARQEAPEDVPQENAFLQPLRPEPDLPPQEDISLQALPTQTETVSAGGLQEIAFNEDDLMKHALTRKELETEKAKERKREEEQAERLQREAAKAALQPAAEAETYQYPPIELLKKPAAKGKKNSASELQETAKLLQQVMEDFGVKATVVDASQGPAVTRFEVQPDHGVKVSKIVSLADDIKLNLAVPDVRIEAPIPGKAAVGIEVPNKENTAVPFRELVEAKEFREHPSKIAFAVGKDISGKIMVADIAKMPHLLIAGATGSGKSVCINTLIMSILYRARPDEVKLIMIDPKVVELSSYNGIPHLLIPVVTDAKKASGALNWAVSEMMERYQKFADLNVRNIEGYNSKIDSIAEIEDDHKPERMPQIVIIVDELADLMMVAPGEVEDAICRLAQLARAAGIHLIIATQRPSVNVITGLIKANMPSRIAFAVSSGVDSRTILDMNGAEKLLGKGDMLFSPYGLPKPLRVQGAFVSDAEVASVVEFLSSQGKTADTKEAEISAQMQKMQAAVDNGGNGSGGGSDRDALFVEAGKFIIEKDKASIGMLQRWFKVGFNRAARIMDQLAEAGVVGEEEGTKPRKVLMSMEEFEQYVDEYV